MFDIQSLTPEQIEQFAMVANPRPILAAAGTGSDADLAGFNPPDARSSNSPGGGYSDLINPQEKKAAPLDPRSMQMLSSMMTPQQQKQQLLGGAAMKQPVPVNLQIPDIASLVKLLQTGTAADKVPTLGSFIQGR